MRRSTASQTTAVSSSCGGWSSDHMPSCGSSTHAPADGRSSGGIPSSPSCTSSPGPQVSAPSHRRAGAAQGAAWIPSGCCSLQACGRPPAACQRRSGAAGPVECLPCPGSSPSRSQWCRWIPPRAQSSCPSVSSRRSACRRAGAAQGAAWTPSGCCSLQACGRPPAACQRRSGAAGPVECPPCPGSSPSRSQWCRWIPPRAQSSCPSVSSRRSACRRAGAAQGAAWTPSGCCSLQACGRPPAACQRRSGAAGPVECLPCPGSSPSRSQWCRWIPPRAQSSCPSVSSRRSACRRAGAAQGAAWIPSGCCSLQACGRPPAACQRRSGAAGPVECLPCPGSSPSRSQWCRWIPPRARSSCPSVSSRRSACRRAGAAQGAAWTPSGCCSLRACGRPPAACQRRSGAAGPAECPPCPGSSPSRSQWCCWIPPRARSSCPSVSSRRSACRYA
ncbi:hypothetical protein ECC02_008847 [Trypanosoma cruzi]|uniref:Uncharacterized protein n=1 Tax=Trypanosoma cruzi TaxID=5693 RepID=A0A7J6XUX0_TRYCR|nr:hypothetical protein ECC02_008847 [Trypanosoma cruzi]